MNKTVPFHPIRPIFLVILVLFIGCKVHNQEKDIIAQIKESKDKGLKDWSYFPIGGAVNIHKVLSDEKLEQIIIKNFNSVTATNDMKMYHIAKSENGFDFNWGRLIGKFLY